MKNLEQLLKMKISGHSPVTGRHIKYSPSFIVDVQEESEKGVKIIIQDTLDFLVKGNKLEQL